MATEPSENQETVTIRGHVPPDKLHELINAHFIPKSGAKTHHPVNRHRCGWCAEEFLGMKFKTCYMALHSDGSTTISCTYK